MSEPYWVPLGAEQAGAIPLVTTLPATPLDGQEVVLTDSLTAPTYSWRLRYTAGISDANKWIFVGGSPLEVGVQTAEGTAAAWTDLATVGPQVTIPRSGLYIVAAGATVTNATANGGGQAAVKRGAAAVSNNDIVASLFVTASNLNQAQGPGSREFPAAQMTAGEVYKLQYQGAVAGTGIFSARWLRLTPVRLA
jgi:hypothetical protein